MVLPFFLAKYRPALAAALRSLLAGYPSPMYDMLRYHLGWLDEQGHPLPGMAGKALRPSLCLLVCEALSGTCRPALPAALALELLHNASLIHDDVQDGDRERRHRPTVWAVWGKPQALNAGTAMASIASLSLQQLADVGVPPGTLARAQLLLYEVCLRLIEGQHLDIGFEERTDIAIAEYLAMVGQKTAASIACALEMGALLAAAGEPAIDALRECGRNLGLAFQIGDDLLGIYGDEAKTGKPVLSDIRRRKKSFPIVYAMEQAPAPARRRLLELYGGTAIDEAGQADVLSILDSVQARAYSQSSIHTCCHEALNALAAVQLPAWARDSLESLAHFLAERQA